MFQKSLLILCRLFFGYFLRRHIIELTRSEHGRFFDINELRRRTELIKALIPDIRRTREQLQLKRMLQNNNEVLLNMFSQEMTFLLDAKERQEELEFKKLDQLIRQQQSFRKSAAESGPVEKLKRLFLPT